MPDAAWMNLSATPLNNPDHNEKLNFSMAVEEAKRIITQLPEAEIVSLRMESDGTWILTWW